MAVRGPQGSSRRGTCSAANQPVPPLDAHDVSRKGKRKPYTPRDHLFSRLSEEFKLHTWRRHRRLEPDCWVG
jgi:hypothetical protein